MSIRVAVYGEGPKPSQKNWLVILEMWVQDNLSIEDMALVEPLRSMTFVCDSKEEAYKVRDMLSRHFPKEEFSSILITDAEALDTNEDEK